MTKTQYAVYLQSPHWRALRADTLKATDECEECALPRWLAEIAYEQDLHVHHVSYARLGREESEDLEVLCARCHELKTFGRSELRAPKAATCEFCESVHWDYRARLCELCTALFTGPGALAPWILTKPGEWEKLMENFVRGRKLHDS